MKVAFCSSEIYPFAKTGGLADVCGALPLALNKIGVETVLFLPKYRCVNSSGCELKKVSENVSQSVLGDGVTVYFIENDSFFDRDGLYGSAEGDYKDNIERFSYFCLKVLETIKDFDMKVDIIHCHDWQTSLIPVYLKEKYSDDEFYKGIKTITTIHNLAFQGIFKKKEFSKLGLTKELFNPNVFEFYEKINLLKGAIVFSDEVTTVSKQYAKEIKTKEFGCGLEEVLASRDERVAGILNGLDYDVWDPQEDDLIHEKYSNENFDGSKKHNKEWLQKEVGFPCSSDTPIFGFVGRLSHQKGIDLIIESLDDLLLLDVQIVIQGVGEEKYYDQLQVKAKKHPQKLAVCFEFDEHLAHQIYAGSDMFLMPSIFEPCGLSQLIAFRYGTIPIVSKTGGLIDTVISYEDKENGNGFVFEKYDKESFVEIVKIAISVFQDKAVFHKLIDDALAVCFSWEKSAIKYKTLYAELKDL